MDRGHPGQLDELRHHFRVIRPQMPNPDQIIRDFQKEIKGITTFMAPVHGKLIEMLPNLEIIAVSAGGYDHVDMAVAKSRGITVTNAPDVQTDDTADLALGLLLALGRRVVEGDAFIRAGMWTTNKFPATATTLTGKKAGIVGMGRIGRAITARLQPFKIEVVYTGPNKKDDVDLEYIPSLEDLAKSSDFLFLTCPGGEEINNLVDMAVMKALGEEGYLINMARGSVVHEDDLLVALTNRHIAGFASDVFAHEPHVPEALFKMDNVVLTPHIGTGTHNTRTKMGQLANNNLIAYFEGRKPINPCH